MEAFSAQGYMDYLDRLEEQSYNTDPTLSDLECKHGHVGYYGLNSQGNPICMKCRRIVQQAQNDKRSKKGADPDRKYHAWGNSIVKGKSKKTPEQLQEWRVNQGYKASAMDDFDYTKVTLECHEVTKWFTEDDPDWVEGRDYFRKGAEQYLDELDRAEDADERRNNFDSEEPYWGRD